VSTGHSGVGQFKGYDITALVETFQKILTKNTRIRIQYSLDTDNRIMSFRRRSKCPFSEILNMQLTMFDYIIAQLSVTLTFFPSKQAQRPLREIHCFLVP